MKKTLIAFATVASVVVPSLAAAQAAAPSPVTGNLTITTDYRFRGISQSFKLPAVQGGIDWASDSGFYLGNWNSSISGNQYPNGASLEMDFYGGYKFALGQDATL
ncbi:MAG TPA: TorF family putative porin, partial [Burkholderiaceae bacterium]|nr:TorF family putative porin [Burkholderiaceae bacterium]